MSYIPVAQLAVWHHKTKNASQRVLLIHGLSEHSGRHSNTIHFLTNNGYDVVSFDLRGAGRSGGRRQWIEKFDDYIEDTSNVFHWIGRELPKLPLFLLGHSLGGAIAIHFTAIFQNTLKGLVLSAPGFKTGPNIAPWKLTAARWLGKLLPKGGIEGVVEGLSRDPAIEQAYRKDPLAFRRNTFQQGAEILKALETIPEQCALIQIPALIVHGTMDSVVSPEGSFEILRSLGSTDKTLQFLPGGYHEPHNDIDKEVYFQILLQWLRSHA